MDSKFDVCPVTYDGVTKWVKVSPSCCPQCGNDFAYRHNPETLLVSCDYCEMALHGVDGMTHEMIAEMLCIHMAVPGGPG